jgi:hypothetical protein
MRQCLGKVQTGRTFNQDYILSESEHARLAKVCIEHTIARYREQLQCCLTLDKDSDQAWDMLGMCRLNVVTETLRFYPDTDQETIHEYLDSIEW